MSDDLFFTPLFFSTDSALPTNPLVKEISQKSFFPLFLLLSPSAIGTRSLWPPPSPQEWEPPGDCNDIGPPFPLPRQSNTAVIPFFVSRRKQPRPFFFFCENAKRYPFFLLPFKEGIERRFSFSPFPPPRRRTPVRVLEKRKEAPQVPPPPPLRCRNWSSLAVPFFFQPLLAAPMSRVSRSSKEKTEEDAFPSAGRRLRFSFSAPPARRRACFSSRHVRREVASPFFFFPLLLPSTKTMPSLFFVALW